MNYVTRGHKGVFMRMRVMMLMRRKKGGEVVEATREEES